MKNISLPKNIFFFFVVILSIAISLSSNSFLGIWMGLELNLSAFIPLFIIKESKKVETSLMIFFLIQSVTSLLMLFSVTILTILPFLKSLITKILFFSIFFKMGIFPFHFWVMKIFENLSWHNCFIFSTIQKVIPLSLFIVMKPKAVLILMCIFNSIGASLSGLNQFSVRKIMAFSSINHLTFMTISSILSKFILKIYFLMYFFTSFFTFMSLKEFNLNYIFQMFSNLKKQKMINMSFIVLMISLAGVPPFLGFFPKLLIIFKMITFKFLISGMIMIFSNITATFFYLRLSISLIFMNMNCLKSKKEKKLGNNFFIFLIILLPIFFFF
uniref:NADH-ubiquinone oxidoreductase chain 2 n=1 Tax=Pseudodendrothrips mori TaxID=1291231 RepID=A0A7M3T294_9NEOP|nr:NADH dehydrogenase subunit 2 [Pseudodendrothrips mori]QFO91088.1 NADH dehydrogenase subunit 2 [Pseudodendrothrips mori]